MPAIPDELVPTVQGYGIGSPTGVDQVAVHGGASRFALLWDRGKQPYQVRLLLTNEKMSVWTAFYLHVVKKGTIAFTMPLDSGFGKASHTVNIVPGSYSAAREGAHTAVTFVVEAESGAYSLSSAEAEALIAAYNGYASTDPPAIPRGFKPLVSGYSFDGPGGAYRSSVEGGNAGYAAFTDRDVQRFMVTLLLNAQQMAVWTAFLHHKIGKGALAFLMPIDSGLGATNHSVNVIPGSHAASRVGKHWTVSFAVEAESTGYDMSDADAQAIVDLYNEIGPGLDLLLARIAQFANEDTLVLQ